MFKKIKEFYKKWIKLGRKIANFQVRFVFTVFYFILIIPFGLIIRLFFKESSGWKEVEYKDIDIEKAREQF